MIYQLHLPKRHRSIIPIWLTAVIYSLALISVYLLNTNTTIMARIGFIIILLVSVCISTKANICLLFLLIPFPRVFMWSYSGFTLLPFIQVITLTKYAIQQVIYKDKHRRRHNGKTEIMLMLFCLYALLGEMIRYSTFVRALTFMLKLFVAHIALQQSDRDRLFSNATALFIISTLFSCFGGEIFTNAASFMRASNISEWNTRHYGLLNDAGEFGQIITCAIAGVVSLYFISTEWRSKSIMNFLVMALVSGVLLNFLLLSGTRASIFSVAFVAVIAVYWMLISKNKKRRAVAVLITLFSGVLIWVFYQYYVLNIFKLHGGEDLSTDNRFRIWANYISAFINNWDIIVFGVGAESGNVYGSIAGIANPHNVVVEKIFELGVLGMTAFSFIMTSMLKDKDLSVRNKKTLPFYAFMLTTLFYGMVGIEIPYFLMGIVFDTQNRRIP